MPSYSLIKQFQRALHEGDPLARVLVIEVNPRSSLDVEPMDEPVVMDERTLEELNNFLGPNYKVVETVGGRIAREAEEAGRAPSDVGPEVMAAMARGEKMDDPAMGNNCKLQAQADELKERMEAAKAGIPSLAVTVHHHIDPVVESPGLWMPQSKLYSVSIDDTPPVTMTYEELAAAVAAGPASGIRVRGSVAIKDKPKNPDNIAQARKAILAGHKLAAIGWIVDEVERLGRRITGTYSGPTPHINIKIDGSALATATVEVPASEPEDLMELAKEIDAEIRAKKQAGLNLPPGPKPAIPGDWRYPGTQDVTDDDPVIMVPAALIKAVGEDRVRQILAEHVAWLDREPPVDPTVDKSSPDGNIPL